MASLADIAKATGLSTATVSLVLSGKAEQYRIAQASVRKVRAAARRLGYTPNTLARGLRTQHSGTIGLVLSDITTAFFGRLAREIEIAAQRHGSHVIVANTNDDPEAERDAIETLRAKAVDGLIVSSVARKELPIQGQNGKPLPVVYIDRVVEGPHVHCVTTDNRRGMYLLTRELLSSGVRHIAYIGGLSHLSTHRERLYGFAEALNEKGLELDKRNTLDGGFDRQTGYRLAARAFARRARPDAVIAAALPLFEGVLEWIGENNPGLLDTTRFATFDDHPLLDFLRVAVPSVRQDAAAMGHAALDALMALVAGQPVPSVTVIPPVLIHRPSKKEVRV
jgi:D-fructose-responsive transcription factor